VGSGEVKVAQGDLILEKDQLVRAPALVKLRHEYAAYKAGQPPVERAKRLVGLAALAAGVLMIFLIAAGRVQPELWRRRRALVMLAFFGWQRSRFAGFCFCRIQSGVRAVHCRRHGRIAGVRTKRGAVDSGGLEFFGGVLRRSHGKQCRWMEACFLQPGAVGRAVAAALPAERSMIVWIC